MMQGPHPLLMLWLSEEPHNIDRTRAGSPVCYFWQAASPEQPQAPARQCIPFNAVTTLPVMLVRRASARRQLEVLFTLMTAPSSVCTTVATELMGVKLHGEYGGAAHLSASDSARCAASVLLVDQST